MLTFMERDNISVTGKVRHDVFNVVFNISFMISLDCLKS